MNTENLFQSKIFKGTVLTVATLIVLGFVFNLGVFVGTKKAEFSFKWADEYHRNFGGPQNGFFGDFAGMKQDFTNSNGVFGQIIKISDGSLTVKDKDNTEKVILVDNKTSIIFQKKNIKLSDIKTGDNIVVIGDPTNNGQIQAELIRMMPPMPTKNPIILQGQVPVQTQK